MITTFTVDAEKKTIHVRRTDDDGKVVIDAIFESRELEALMTALKKANRQKGRSYHATVTL